MFDYKELKSLHLEITNLCQAACPMCTRNIQSGLKNPLLRDAEWTLEDYKTILPKDIITQLEKIMFCGNFGDPLLNDDLIGMCEYTRSINPSITIRIHTNGSLRNKEWWRKLASVLPKNHQVIFAIDGLKGTHELYRINTSFDKIIENAKEFIAAGGKAEWAYLRFKHNQDQVEEARIMAKELGFETFVMKDSSRFLITNTFDVLDKDGKPTHQLQSSDYSNLNLISEDIIKNYRLMVDDSEITCYVQQVKEVYIDAHMTVMPCCWVGALPYIYRESNQTIGKIRDEIYQEYNNLLAALGGKDRLDASKNHLRDIINSAEYQTVWQRYWSEQKMITCARSCGVSKRAAVSRPNEQFITRENLSQ
jgi:MoaA/NifB/PqqE/SkfB family radical SAM enzyme